MKTALAVPVAAVLAALTLAACGGGATSTSKAATGSSTSKAATAAPTPASAGKTTESLTAKGAKASSTEADDDKPEKMSEAIKVLDDMPSQDELDAAAAARITEASADAEYQQLKAEIEADIAKPDDGG